MNRFTISLDEQLARQFDQLIAERRYCSRSEAVRDLILHRLSRASTLACDAETAGQQVIANVGVIYEASDELLALRLRTLRQAQHALVLSSHHSPMSDGLCLESVALRGPRLGVCACIDQLSTLRGIQHVTVNMVVLRQDKEVATQPQGHSHAPSIGTLV